MHNHLDRNLAGYGANPPDPQWPGDARIAVSFVLNYEEGGENTILNGDPASEVFLTETPGGTPGWASAISRPSRCTSTAAGRVSGASCASSTSAA